MEIISHIRKTANGEFKIQSNQEHSDNVSILAEQFASSFGFASFGKVLGLLHDKGKESNAFQSYIREKSGYDFDNVHPYDDKSHAYVGAILANQMYGPMSEPIKNQIAGHHAGMYDYMELNEKLKHDIPDGVNSDFYKVNLDIEGLKRVKSKEEFHHLWRMLYSCLVDADFLDTERFMNSNSSELRGYTTTMEELNVCLKSKLEKLSSLPDTSVNRIRRQIQYECLKKSGVESGFYSLTVPTGGGKTISSMVWAVNHAIKNEKKRIIIAIPYTSIVVQTASVLKSIFGEDNVLEHHSSSDYEQIQDSTLKLQMKLATENWDYPIVVTTNVQLFESMFSNKPSDCRKLHNICNSVVILDEVQTLPVDFLQPIVDSLKCYQRLFGVSVLFTTASQPILSGVIEGCNPTAKFIGIDHIEEIIPAGLNLHEQLRRVELSIDDDGKSYDEIAQMLCKHNKVLCIVNNRKAAKELFDRLPNEGLKLHLSKMMCPAHIRKTIDLLKKELESGKEKVIRVVSTQLIEAGVDIDFSVVYRQEAGLDSVLQAAGRCNREGKHNLCTTFVFSLGKEGNLPPGSMTIANNARKNIVGDFDWFAPEAMYEYFRQLYCRVHTFDSKDISHYLYKPAEMCFESAAKAFRLIDDNGVNVIVNWGEGMKLVDDLKHDGASYNLMKKLSQYSVCVRECDFKEMMRMGLIIEVVQGVYVAYDSSQYGEYTGLSTANHWQEEVLIK